MNNYAKFGLALMIIAGGGLIIDAEKPGASFQTAIASSVHVPLIFFGAAVYLTHRKG